jgi:nucleotide-binding universal stress UspA family protein
MNHILPAHVTFIGAVLALIFTTAMVTVIRWLLRVPPPIPAVAAHAKRAVSAIRKIVVPTNMHTYWERAVELACRLGETQKAEIVLMYVIEIPFTLSLDASMAKAHKTGEEILQKAASIVKNHGLPARTVSERARQAGEGIARLAKDEDADLIVMATPKMRKGLPSVVSRTIEILLHRAPCEVIIDAVANASIEEEPVLDNQQINK